MSKSDKLKSLRLLYISAFLPPKEELFTVTSDEAEVGRDELVDPNMRGPLVFLKIEGDKHFFPPS